MLLLSYKFKKFEFKKKYSKIYDIRNIIFKNNIYTIITGEKISNINIDINTNDKVYIDRIKKYIYKNDLFITSYTVDNFPLEKIKSDKIENTNDIEINDKLDNIFIIFDYFSSKSRFYSLSKDKFTNIILNSYIDENNFIYISNNNNNNIYSLYFDNLKILDFNNDDFNNLNEIKFSDNYYNLILKDKILLFSKKIINIYIP